MKNTILASFIISFTLIAALGVMVWMKTSASAPKTAVSTGKAAVGGPFTLVDVKGRTVKEESFRGKWMLVYFGFSSCPGICPAGLQTMGNVLAGLAKESSKIAPLFITFDPERDTPEKLSSYMQNFDPRIIALTGTPKQVEQATGAYKVYVSKIPGTPTMGYMFDHSSYIYLMDKEGNYAAHFASDEKPEKIVAKVKEVRGEGR